MNVSIDRTNDSVWRIRDIAYALLAYFSVEILIVLLESLTFGGIVSEESNIPLGAFVVEEVIDAVILFGVAVYFIRTRYKAKLSSVGLHGRHIMRNLSIGVVVGIFLWLTLSLLDLGMRWAFWGIDVKHPLIARAEKSGSLLGSFALVASGGIVSPIAEEMFLRGFAYTVLKKRLKIFMAVIITNVVFSLLHVEFQWFLQIFVTGVVLTLIFEWSGSLVTVIISHSIVNCLVLGFAAMRLAQPFSG